MKSIFKIVAAPLFVVLIALAPASAYAASGTKGARTHSQTYHDRTPRAHTHGSHPRR